MTATQTVAVTSAPGMKAREPSFTLDSDDELDDVEREISTRDESDDGAGTGATAAEKVSTAPGSTIEQFELDVGMAGLRVATGREDPPASDEPPKPFWEHDFASEYDFARAHYSKAVEEATSPQARTAGQPHVTHGKSGLRVDPKEAERWRRAARERAQVVTELASSAGKRMSELWDTLSGKPRSNEPAPDEDEPTRTQKQWTEMRGAGDGEGVHEGELTDPHAPTGDPSFGGRDRSPRAPRDDYFNVNPAVIAAEDRCAAAEAATQRAEEKIEALVGELSDARKERDALRAALREVQPTHRALDAST